MVHQTSIAWTRNFLKNNFQKAFQTQQKITKLNTVEMSIHFF
ncbi:hypothetical protein CPter91_2992 [Collimonas pratensis]|uniref:Uncharacterized protein n=1 Tax=Collimonas pratensis TaxID=279113 RepID=A0A127Q5M7_9BURK|nr:hypothetical protein CPter91_2992 [Collimonas pratensis]